MGTKDWNEARFTRERWLEWGQTTQPVADIDKLKRRDVTVAEAVDFFFKFAD